ncbi:hypothetical protein ACVWZ4_000964 [Bradyrhizobium sp. USDA 4472]
MIVTGQPADDLFTEGDIKSGNEGTARTTAKHAAIED